MKRPPPRPFRTAPVLALTLALALSGLPPLAAAQAGTVAPQPGAAPAGYILGPNDEISVAVFGTYPFEVKTRISEKGSVTLPTIGMVEAQGKTANALADLIRGKLIAAGQFVDPIVNVEVVKFVSRAVTLLGRLETPGLYPLDRQQTVGMMLAQAGGARADAADYVILKRAGEPDRPIPLDDLTGETGTGRALRAGDTLFVPKAEDVFIYGQVNKPGRYTFETGMTVRQVLAQAGGPTLGGSENKISLHRDNRTTKRVTLDAPVQPGDVFTVRERIF